MTAVAGARLRRRTILRRRLAAVVAIVAVLAGIAAVVRLDGSGQPAGPTPSGRVRLELGGRTIASAATRSLSQPAGRAALLAALPTERTVRAGGAVIRFRVDRGASASPLLAAVRAGGGTVRIPEHAVSSRIAVPLVKQALPNDCEAASLAMLMSFRGRPVDQLTLQKRVAHSPPLDPTVAPDGSEIWGDPRHGFVGRADGGGPAGGFGVYQGPIRALAEREGVRLRDLTGTSPRALYAALLAGHPVLAWVALSNGPYATWETLSGQTVRINWGEHALVLTGVGPQGVRVNEPLAGIRVVWSKEQFEAMWRGLGSRALAA
ncbi:MAG: C39 family peptidase [Syntrophothermus sp.]